LIDIPEGPHQLWLVFLFEDRLYTWANKTLYVYSVGDLTSPPATYPLADLDICYSALIADNRLYLGGIGKLQIFEVTTSITEPLIPVTKISTNGGQCGVYKIMRVGDDIFLG
jgi:hypothetical protein